jgi:pimeloyl-ACP methyl ester carboxylesterase
MTRPHGTTSRERPEERLDRSSVARAARERLLVSLPVTEARLPLAGVSTALLEAGAGPPLVLLHGPGAHAFAWMEVIPDLVRTHRVIAPDLPGHGASVVGDGPLDSARVLAWLGELLEHAGPTPPTLVGHALGGAIAARYAGQRGDRLVGLVLVDMLGLVPFQPTPAFGHALSRFLTQPTEETHDGLWQHCAFDLDHLRARLGERWEWLRAYNVDRAGAPDLRTVLHGLMEEFGMPAIPAADLARIAIPTTLVRGRRDPATPLAVAETASTRYGWPLLAIEDAGADVPLDQPQAFLAALRRALVAAAAGPPR